MWKRKSAVYALVMLSFLVFFVISAPAVDVGVLIDVSGSLRSLPVQEAREMLTALILESRLPSNWKISDSNEENLFFRQLAQGKGEPLIQPGDRFLFMKFGSLRSPKYPYFRQPVLTRVQSPDEIRNLIAQYYPQKSEHTESNTYDDLALPVASEELKRNGSNHWYLFVVSDFLTDYIGKPSLTPDQVRMRSGFLVKRNFTWDIPIVINHTTHRTLEVRVYDVRPKVEPLKPEKNKQTPPPPPPQPIGLPMMVIPKSPMGKIDQKRPLFKWAEAPGTDYGADKYELKVFQEGKLVFHKETENTQIRANKDLTSGKYTWMVISHAKGEERKSPVQPFTVKGSIQWGWVLLLLIPLGLLGLLRSPYWKALREWWARKMGRET